MRVVAVLVLAAGCQKDAPATTLTPPAKPAATAPAANEPEVMLNRIGAAAKAHFEARGQFPMDAQPLTPAKSCCEQNYQGRAACADPGSWATPAWQSLGFRIEEPHFFQYGYFPTAPDAFTAVAVGNLDCDATNITYTLSGATPGGIVQLLGTSPVQNSD